MNWELSLPSSFVTTFLVLFVDVIALWLLDNALLRVAAFLNARVVYDTQKSIKVSDVWFESISGRSHGPVWFRKAQVAIKFVMLVCSIAVGLSIDGLSRDREVRMPNETVLVRQVRRMEQHGIGGFNDFSIDVLFMKNSFRCTSRDYNASTDLHMTTYWNARALMPISRGNCDHDYNLGPGNRLFPLECLSDRNNFSVSPVRQKPFNVSYSFRYQNCFNRFPELPEIKSGFYTVTLNSTCPWHFLRLECQAKLWGGYALTMERGEDQMLRTWEYRGQTQPQQHQRETYKWRKRDRETLGMMAMYLDFGLRVPAIQLDHVTSFQAGNRNITKLKGRSLLTEINVGLFLTRFIFLVITVLGSIVSAVISYSSMVMKKRSDYALGLRVAELA